MATTQHACEAPTWAASTVYAVGDRVVTVAVERVYECISGGTSGGSEPTSESNPVTDNGVTWNYLVTRDYSDHADAEAGTDINLSSGIYNVLFLYRGDNADESQMYHITATITIAGATRDGSNPPNATSYRTFGVYEPDRNIDAVGTAPFVTILHSPSSAVAAISVTEDFFRLEWHNITSDSSSWGYNFVARDEGYDDVVWDHVHIYSLTLHSEQGGIFVQNTGNRAKILFCVVREIEGEGIRINYASTSGGDWIIFCCSLYDMGNVGGGAISVPGATSGGTISNNAVCMPSGDTSKCFNIGASYGGGGSHNLSSDDTADDIALTNAQLSKAATDTFEDPANGDLSMKSGSAATSNGTSLLAHGDLPASPNFIAIDWAGDAVATMDDIGADQEAAAGGGRIMSSLVGAGGLAGTGGIAGRGGGLAG